jgi:2-polyprenyl-6-methoxyphenol hydroxylase-like FAD-dependent oxidoreductase
VESETVTRAGSDSDGDTDGNGDSGGDGDSDDDRSRSRRQTGSSSLMTPTDERQVLVVGDGIAGLAVTATLRHVGYDPVLLARPDRTYPSRLAALHPAGQSLLADVTADPLRAGDAEAVRLCPDGGREGTAPVERGHPVALTTDDLRTRLTTAVPDDAVREEGVRTLEREGNALRVRFESGVREWFDLVVAADGPGSTVRAVRDAPLRTDSVMQVEARLDADTETAQSPREVWTERGLVQAVPHPHGGYLVRLTGPAFPADDQSPGDRVRRAVDALDGGELVPSDLSAVRRTEVAQCPPGGSHWGDGRVVYCGGAALPLAPATGLGATLALADARVFADELLVGPSAVADAVDAYGRQRRRHVDRLREAAESRPEGREGPSPALASVSRFRSASARGGDLLADPNAL